MSNSFPGKRTDAPWSCPFTHLDAYSIYNSISFYRIPFKKALYRAEDKEFPGVFLLLLRDIKVAKNLFETVSMFM